MTPFIFIRKDTYMKKLPWVEPSMQQIDTDIYMENFVDNALSDYEECKRKEK